MQYIVSSKLKKLAANIFLTLLVTAGWANITGFTPRYAEDFNKAVTFRDYQMYKSDIVY